MAETSGLDLVWLQKRAELCGAYVNRHLVADEGEGDLYCMMARNKDNPKPATLAKFATVEEIENCLTAIEEENLRLKRRA